MRMRVFGRWCAVAAAGALAVGAGVPAAGSAGAARAAVPGWRVEKVFSDCENDGVQAVTATAASNAWATGQWARFTSGNCGQQDLLIAHWDGTRWSILRSPAGFAGDEGYAVATLSPSYAWVFVNHPVHFPPPSAAGFALRWQNGTWRSFQLAGGAVISSAVTFGQSNAWGFGERFRSTGPVAAYAVHFNGQGWSAVSIPVLPQGTASPAPDNIWAVGPLAGATGQPVPQPYALAHWTGRWQTIPFPNLGLPSGEGVTHAWVVADNANGAWIAGDVSDGGGVLLHWTGSSWVNVSIPLQATGLGPLSHDGQGGLWMYTSCGSCVTQAMAHYNSAGQWSLAPITLGGAEGVTPTAMRLIPGTDSVWASAGLLANSTDYGGMLKYGP